MQMLDNLKTRTGTFSSGFNPTAYLQPGENTLELVVAPIGVYEDDYTYHGDNQCEMTLYGAFPNGEKEEMSSLHITIEEGKPNAKASKTYPANHRTPLVDVDGLIKGYTNQFSRPVNIKTIPRWRWVDATPIREDNPEQMKQLYRAYSNLIELMEKRDFEGLKMAYSLSMREHAKADGYFAKPEDFYDAVEFEDTFATYPDAKVKPRRDWSEYQFKSYMDGRLVRLMDKKSSSPLRITSAKNDLERTFTPYFSMIDGRVVVSR
ncbi:MULTISPECIES: glycosyl hydrolase family 26 [Vibrio]|uniref:Glycosyl hydrolase family 26 n=4 Tax=Vibrio anguillarum TaxID=55601 RepID=A0A290Q3R9_VIBAN|nr:MULTISPECIES: glycosyl hydrolase family 26 [Vibrio]ASW83410.1 glycosyl hydrolase family 26 [Vibrio anguillarum]ATC59998.1 glycosyl hydrolase family 26 [Vibrio anguillarum]AXN05244.1 glycosyl hydrolase family 26 [Vibrio anguillarum]AZS27491.1 glycosyl hydrolase family 26 [Vibrio anguillarum]MBF4252971.1 glycosyl hydrolase family 26 [Vibrio anguillarum]